jgi:hypothetical protein
MVEVVVLIVIEVNKKEDKRVSKSEKKQSD